MTKKITVYLNDETAETLDKLVKLQQYYNYPEYQAYGLLIDQIVMELKQISMLCPNQSAMLCPNTSPKMFICL